MPHSVVGGLNSSCLTRCWRTLVSVVLDAAASFCAVAASFYFLDSARKDHSLA